MVLTITTAEETVRSHTKIIADEKKKLIETSYEQAQQSLGQIMNAITSRQTNALQPSQVILKTKVIGFRPRSDNRKHGWCRRSNVIHMFSHVLPSSPIVRRTRFFSFIKKIS